jgi:ATP-dependent Clp protease adaptor protein ClpS|tara:strand:+ start:396 stop:722 length:327 start_codon:yes stop_codon:yes gene_type:complete
MPKFIKNIDQDNEVLIKKNTKKKLKKPSLYKVVMLNDDYTPMDFVVYLLKTFFKKNHEEASKIMLDVHNKGAATCGIFTFEIAETKILKVINTSRNNGFPLLCILEKI